ncbi:endonuclease domain-containing protein [Nocardiopsis rhodophaea]|uniref:endonuclease domain-containing protein n=1 Tax=Nocardiopsis rhodophaea TaxID=280238 RepID=UPI0031D6E75E
MDTESTTRPDGRMSGPRIPGAAPHGLDALPDHRRLVLMWRHALTYTQAELDERVREWSVHGCRTYRGRHIPPQAVLGDDGRHHMWHEGRMLCGFRAKRAPRSAPWKHDQSAHWWTDGTRYRIQVPRDIYPDGDVRSVTIRWAVHPVGEAVDAASVPPAQRCPAHILGWPTWIGRPGKHGQVRRRLVSELGPGCAVCTGPGEIMDHDPFTGLVRGLLCRHCNTHVDTCPHVRGCAWAQYLNEPPARGLRAAYPDVGKNYAKTLDRAVRAGWDPQLLADVRARTPQGMEPLF